LVVDTRRRTLEWSIGIVLLLLFLAVPFLRQNRSVITTLALVALVTFAIVRGKPEGIRFLLLSVAAAFAGVLLFVLALAAIP
jgi:hypothetical protein